MGKIFIFVAISIIALIAIVIFISIYLFKKAFIRNSENDSLKRDKIKKYNKVFDENTLKWFEELEKEKHFITSFDGIELFGTYIKFKNETTKTVIVGHGYGDTGLDMIKYVKFLYEELKCNIFLPDCRGHGNSEGKYIGFGWLDRLDYLKWIEYLIEIIGSRIQIGLFGISMSGASVMMLSGEGLPNQVKAIVEDCGYSSLYEQLLHQMKKNYKLPAFPILSIINIFTKFFAKYSFYEALSVKQVNKSKVPILFIHGSNDKFVPKYMLEKNYESCNCDKDILIIENAGHGLAYDTEPLIYKEKIINFFDKYM